MRINILIVLYSIISIILTSCRHVDTVAQKMANQGIIYRGTANMISISARAFGDIAINLTPEEEYYLGRTVAGSILSSYHIWDESPELVNYLNLICSVIVINSPKPHVYKGYYVAILDSDEVNALTTPGGHIFLTRGLLQIAQSEDALAAVIAHEIAHQQLQHALKSIKSSRLTNAVFVTATAGAGNIIGMDVNEAVEIFNEAVGEIVQTLANNGYSKEQEYEADIAAMVLMAAAGYDPSAIIDILEELKKISVIGSRFSRTHPRPEQRIYYAENALCRFNTDASNSRLMRQERFLEVLKESTIGLHTHSL